MSWQWGSGGRMHKGKPALRTWGAALPGKYKYLLLPNGRFDAGREFPQMLKEKLKGCRGHEERAPCTPTPQHVSTPGSMAHQQPPRLLDELTFPLSAIPTHCDET